MSDLPRIIPGDTPRYVVGDGEIVLLYSRTVPVTCAVCCLVESFKLLSDDVLSDAECDKLLENYLCDVG